jgi:hypothetical protein
VKYLILTILVASGLAAQADILTSTQRFFGLGGQSPDYTESAEETQASILGQAPYSPADSDLGVQEILEERGDREPVSFDFNSSFLLTDTAPSGNPLTDRSSWVLISSAAIGWRPHLAQGWFADLGLGYDMVRYDRTNALDYENMVTRLGVFRVMPELDDTIFFARYEYQRITSKSLTEGDYNAQRIRAGLQKVLWSAPRQQLSGSLSGAYEWSAHPQTLERNEISLDLSYRYAFTDSLYTVISARASRFAFDEKSSFVDTDERRDWTYGLSAGLFWQISEHFSANASVFFDKNDSNTRTFFGPNANEYEAWSGGIGFGAQWLF